MIELQPGGVVFIRAFLSVTAGILVLFAGKAINQRVQGLREANIPEPVTGGLLFALTAWMIYLVSGYQVVFDLHIRDVLLVYFFVTIGINARISDLKAGGRPLAILLTAVGVFLVLQDLVGSLAAVLLGQPIALGVLAGSISMSGGHGTAVAWAPAFVQKGIPNALEIGVMAATAGLVLASLVGGPLARYLIEKHRLEPAKADVPGVGVHYGDTQPAIDYFSFLRALLAIHVCGFIGVLSHQGLGAWGVQLPLFVPCLFAGIMLTNLLPIVAPRVAWPSHTPALALIAELSLGIFLAMSLMSMQLWALAGLAGALTVLLALQVALVALFAVGVVFPVLGRTYDAAVVCAGFIGFGLGATPTAMANMTAVTQRHGGSRIAFLVVPLVGAFFIDLLNSLVIRLFLSFM